jgi:hypothetical protein
MFVANGRCSQSNQRFVEKDDEDSVDEEFQHEEEFEDHFQCSKLRPYPTACPRVLFKVINICHFMSILLSFVFLHVLFSIQVSAGYKFASILIIFEN